MQMCTENFFPNFETTFAYYREGYALLPELLGGNLTELTRGSCFLSHTQDGPCAR